jgi:hypothetical protein
MLRDALRAAEPGSSLEQLTPQDRMVLWTLVTFSDWDTGANARPGMAILSQVVGAHPKSVQRSIRRLVDIALIQRTGRASPGHAATYSIDLQHVENGAGTGNRGFPNG